MSEYRIIDAHAHIYPDAIAEKASENLGKFYNFKVQGKGTLSDLENEARNASIEGFFIFGVATNAHQVKKVNDTLAEACALAVSHGFRAEGFAGMHQDYDDFESEVKRCKELGFQGVKIHPDIQGVDTDDKRLLPLYEIMQALNMRLVLHAGDDRPEYRYSSPDKIAKIAKMFPKMKILAAHFGGYKAWDEAEEYLFGLENLWYDCSSALWAMTPERAAELFRKCGYKRVMFGTDYPVMPLNDYLKLFFEVPLTSREREDVLYNNAIGFLSND